MGRCQKNEAKDKKKKRLGPPEKSRGFAEFPSELIYIHWTDFDYQSQAALSLRQFNLFAID